MLSFVCDIADLYKTDVTMPLAFRTVAEGEKGIDSRIRKACRDSFYENRTSAKIIPDIDKVLDIPIPDEMQNEFDVDNTFPGGNTSIESGVSYNDGEVWLS